MVKEKLRQQNWRELSFVGDSHLLTLKRSKNYLSDFIRFKIPEVYKVRNFASPSSVLGCWATGDRGVEEGLSGG